MDFLAVLREHNDREWFQAHREEYEDGYVDPAKAVTGAQLAQIARDVESAGLELGREHYKRHPRGYADDGPAARFLRFDALRVFHALPARTTTDPKLLLPTCQRIWRQLAPLQRWLVNNTS